MKTPDQTSGLHPPERTISSIYRSRDSRSWVRGPQLRKPRLSLVDGCCKATAAGATLHTQLRRKATRDRKTLWRAFAEETENADESQAVAAAAVSAVVPAADASCQASEGPRWGASRPQ